MDVQSNAHEDQKLHNDLHRNAGHYLINITICNLAFTFWLLGILLTFHT